MKKIACLAILFFVATAALASARQIDASSPQQAVDALASVGGEPNPNSDNGKGKKKGHNRSSCEPLAAPFGS